MIPMDTYIRFRTNHRKALETILWMADKQPGIGFHSILKLLFFADKYHLNTYGRPVIGDQYIAMTYGPVASATYDLLKGDSLAAEFAGEDPLPFMVHHNGNRPHVIPTRPPNLDLFSESDLEALDWSFQSYKHLSFDDLTEISHRELAYRNAERRGLNSPIWYEDMIDESDYREDILSHMREAASELVL